MSKVFAARRVSTRFAILLPSDLDASLKKMNQMRVEETRSTLFWLRKSELHSEVKTRT